MSSLLPPSVTSLEKSLDEVAEKRLESSLLHRDIFNPWKCRADLLGVLAWSLGVDDWSSEMTEQQRREACASAIRIHRQRGTVASIKQALTNAGYAGASITEGLLPVTFNGVTLYDGSESHASGGRWAMFRIDVDLGETNGVSATDTQRLRRILERTAPARCELVGTQYSAAISDKATVTESAHATASPKISDIRPAGRRYDGSISHSQGQDLLQNSALLFGGQRKYSGFIVTGEQHNNAWDDGDLAAGLSLGSDRVAIQPTHGGTFTYSGFDYGYERAVAAEAPLTITLTKHRRYNGKLQHMTDAFDGSFKYNAARNYQPDITYLGQISTTESTL